MKQNEARTHTEYMRMSDERMAIAASYLLISYLDISKCNST